jgi:hypothetical protein
MSTEGTMHDPDLAQLLATLEEMRRLEPLLAALIAPEALDQLLARLATETAALDALWRPQEP